MVPKICSVDGCSSSMGPKGARGLCSKHYQMWIKTGDPCGTTARTDGERFWPKVDKSGECWLWLGSKDGCGYGMFSTKGKNVRTHRWAYENLVGKIPSGLVMDHLCRTPNCVRPSHLEPVTNDENLERGWGRRIKNKMSNSCLHGHEFTPENTYMTPKGCKSCRICRANYRLAYQKRKAV